MIQNINSLPLLLGEREADGMEALLGRMGVDKREFNNFFKNSNGLFESTRKSPLLNYDWQLPYSLDDFSKKFFDQSKTIKRENFTFNFGGPEPLPEDKGGEDEGRDEFHKIIEFDYIRFNDNNGNKVYDIGDTKIAKLLSYKLYFSKDGAWLLNMFKKLGTVLDDEIVLFIEVDDKDVVSDKVVLCKAGKTAAPYLKSSEFIELLNKRTKINNKDVNKLIKSCRSLDEDGLLKDLNEIIDGLAIGKEWIMDKVAELESWATDKVGGALIWFGNLFEELRIDEKNWDEKNDFTTGFLENGFAANTFIQKIIKEKGIWLNSNNYKPFIGPYKTEDNIFIPLPDYFIKIIVKIDEFLTKILNNFKSVFEFYGAMVEMSIAAICGIYNGLIDLIGGLFIFVGHIIKFIGIAIKGGVELANNMQHYNNLIKEYIDNFIQAIFAIDWLEVIKNVCKKCIEVYKAVSKAISNINKKEIAYFCRYVLINILACTIGLGEISAVLRIGKLTGQLAELVEIAYKAVSKLPKVLALSLEGLMDVIGAVVGIMYQGTKAVLELINKIFAAIVGYLIKEASKVGEKIIGLERALKKGAAGLEKKKEGIKKGLDNKGGKYHSEGILGSKILTAEELRLWEIKINKLSNNTCRFKMAKSKELLAYMERENSIAFFDAYEIPPIIYYKKGVTEYVISHEAFHLEEFMAIGKENFLEGSFGTIIERATNTILREQYVYKKILDNAFKFTDTELRHAHNYYIDVLAKAIEKGVALEIKYIVKLKK